MDPSSLNPSFVPPISNQNSSSASSTNPQLNAQVNAQASRNTPLNLEISHLINTIHGDNEINKVVSEKIRLFSNMANMLSNNLNEINKNKAELEIKINEITNKIKEVSKPVLKYRLSQTKSALLQDEQKALSAEANTVKDLNEIKKQLAINQSLLDTGLKQEEKRLVELTRRINTFTELPTHSENYAIFKLENEIRNFINRTEAVQFEEFEALNHVKNAIIEIYNNKIIPQLERAKTAIKDSHDHIIANQASLKGKASTVLFKFVADSRLTVLTEKAHSTNEVYVREADGLVIKVPYFKKREEEEDILNGLAAIKSERGFVGSFKAKDTSIDRLNFITPFNEKEQNKIYPIKGPLLENFIKTYRPSQQSSTGSDFKGFSIASIHPDSLSEFKNEIDLLNRQKDYDIWKNQVFEYTILPNEEFHKINFKKLSDYFEASYIPEMRIKNSQTNEILTFQEFLEKQPSLCKALQFKPKQLLDAYLHPLLETDEKEKIYEKCNRLVWSYQTYKPDGTLLIGEKTTFHKLMELYLQGYQFDFEKLEACPPLQSSIDFNHFPLDSNDLTVMFNLQWVVASQHVVKMENDIQEKLTDLVAKPFLSEMVLLQNLRAERPVVFDRIMSNLSDNAQYNAILTGEVQTLDLHKGNIGLAPVSIPSYEKFKDRMIKHNKIYYTFKDFMYLYLEGKVNPDDDLFYLDHDQKLVKKTINTNSELYEALNTQWEFIFFDLDLSLAEGNDLIKFCLNDQLGYHIPYRCALLELPWKNIPLSPEVISRLNKDSEISYDVGSSSNDPHPKMIISKDQQMRNWLKKEDSPVKQRLSEEGKKKLDLLLDPLLARYSFKTVADQNASVDMSVKDLQEQFKHDLANKLVDPHKAVEIWQLLEKELSTEKFPIDLTSSDSEVMIEKRKRIAGHLFPRATVEQQKALIERQDRRHTYLKEFAILKSLEGAPLEELGNGMMKFLTSKASSLSTKEKDLYSAKILICSKINKDFDSLIALYREFYIACYPSPFNLIKVMYPLLADAYDLYFSLFKDEKRAGSLICNYINPLNEIIEGAKQQQDPYLEISATQLENRMNEVKKKNLQLFDVFSEKEDLINAHRIFPPAKPQPIQPAKPGPSQQSTKTNSPDSSSSDDSSHVAEDPLTPSSESSPYYAEHPLNPQTKAIHVQSQDSDRSYNLDTSYDSDTSDEVDSDSIYFESDEDDVDSNQEDVDQAPS